jgi:transcriptional regulator with XRE-family HTH domain
MANLPDIDTFYKELGERIKTERLRKKINQEKLGESLDLTRVSINNLESGRHRVSLYQLILIARILDLPYTDLIPYGKKRNSRKTKSAEPDFKNAIIDQDSFKTTTKAVVRNFLSSINKKPPL